MNYKVCWIRLILCGLFFTASSQAFSLSNCDLNKRPHCLLSSWILTCIENVLKEIRNLFGNLYPKTTQSIVTTSTTSPATSTSNPNLPLFAIGGSSGRIQVYSQKFEPIINFTAHDQGVERLLSIPNKGILASCSDDASVKLWNTTDWSLIRAYNKQLDEIWAIEYLDSDLMVSSSFDLSTHIWSISTGETVFITQTQQPITCLKKISKNLLAGGDFDDIIYLWNFTNTSLTLVGNLTGIGLLVDDIVLVSENVLATSNDDFTISIWNLTTQSLLRNFKAHSSNVNALKLLSSNLILSASADHTIKIWNVDTGALVNTLNGHQAGIIYALDLLKSSNGSNILMSGSLDKTIKIWYLSLSNEVTYVQTINTDLSISALVII